MKLQCYEEGKRSQSLTRYEHVHPAIAARAFAVGWRGDSTRPVNVVVVPADDEARAMFLWRGDADEPFFALFRVEATVDWIPREVGAFNA